MSDGYGQIVSLLHRVMETKAKDGLPCCTACCPCHDDKDPSGSLGVIMGRDGTHKLVWKCFAAACGASLGDVCAGLGLDLAEVLRSHDARWNPEKALNQGDTTCRVYVASPSRQASARGKSPLMRRPAASPMESLFAGYPEKPKRVPGPMKAMAPDGGPCHAVYKMPGNPGIVKWRRNTKGGKVIRWMHQANDGSWEGGTPENFVLGEAPLYGDDILDDLLRRRAQDEGAPARPITVLWVEGENVADALNHAFNRKGVWCVAVSAMTSSVSPDVVNDLLALPDPEEGDSIILMPDFDAAGYRTMEMHARALAEVRRAGDVPVSVIDMLVLAEEGKVPAGVEVFQGFDGADLVAAFDSDDAVLAALDGLLTHAVELPGDGSISMPGVEVDDTSAPGNPPNLEAEMPQQSSSESRDLLDGVRQGLGVERLDPNEDLGEAEYMIAPLIAAQGISLLSGLPKTGKSAIILWLVCKALRNEDPVPGLLTLGEVPTRKVLLLTEMSVRQTKQYVRLFDPDGDLADRLGIFAPAALGKVTTPDELAAVLTALVERDGYDLVVIDTLIRWSFTKQGESLNDQTVAGRTFAAFRSVCDATGASILVAAHNRKDSEKSRSGDMNAIAGSVSIRASTDVNAVVRLVDEETTVIEISVEGRNVGLMRHLAQSAEATAQGEPPPLRMAGMIHRFRLRLGWTGDRIEYRQAEGHLAAQSGSAGVRHLDPDLHRRLLVAVEDLSEKETDLAAREQRPPVYCFSVVRIQARLSEAWPATVGGRPGERMVSKALGSMAESRDDLRHFDQWKYPLPGGKTSRSGGYVLTKYAPATDVPRTPPERGAGHAA